MRITGLLWARMRATGRTSDKAAADSAARRVVGMIPDPRDASLSHYLLTVGDTSIRRWCKTGPVRRIDGDAVRAVDNRCVAYREYRCVPGGNVGAPLHVRSNNA